MLETGLAHIGIGKGTGDNKAEEAAKQAISSPLLETSIEGAKGVLLNITGGPDLGLQEVNLAAELIQNSADPEANIIFGAVIDENLKDEMLITVIATGFDKSPVLKRPNKLLDATHVGEAAKAAAATQQDDDDGLDIPVFLKRNRFR